MKNRIQHQFEQLRKDRKKGLVIFITAGDPNLKATEKMVLQLEDLGVDLIELGVPFSDPMADGPVIQRASERALRAGTTLHGVLDTVENLRQKLSIPLILMGYYNPVFQMGNQRFAQTAAKKGADGVLLVDLPPEEAQEISLPLSKADLSWICLLTPTSDLARVEKIRHMASGFVYYVSMTGITGATLNDLKPVQTQIEKIKKIISLPVCVGFGIQETAQAAALAETADGVVIGSSLISILESKGEKAFLNQVKAFRKVV